MTLSVTASSCPSRASNHSQSNGVSDSETSPIATGVALIILRGRSTSEGKRQTCPTGPSAKSLSPSLRHANGSMTTLLDSCRESAARRKQSFAATSRTDAGSGTYHATPSRFWRISPTATNTERCNQSGRFPRAGPTRSVTFGTVKSRAFPNEHVVCRWMSARNSHASMSGKREPILMSR
jgi:hypothetical protein